MESNQLNETNSMTQRGQFVDNAEEAHGVAWASFEAKGELKKVYLKHPDLGDKEIRINVLYTGICQSDVSVLQGKYGFGRFPAIAGHEIIGTVYELGKSVKEFVVGDLVGVGPMRDCCEECTYCTLGKENLCEAPINKLTINPWFGGFATSVQVPAVYTFKIPDGISPESAPPLMCAGGTVFAPLRKYGKIGGKVAVLGMGGLGHLAVQYASKMGMKTFAVSTSESRKEAITKLGAHEYVNSSDPEQFKKFMGEKIDLIINTTGTGDADVYMRALKKGSGVFVQIGGPESEFKINVAEILFNEWALVGSAAASKDDMKCVLEFSKNNKVS